MGTPNPCRMPEHDATGRNAHFYLHRLGQLEFDYRDTAERLLLLLEPDDDRAIAVRRVLDRFEH